jgi:hypothetical protein
LNGISRLQRTRSGLAIKKIETALSKLLFTKTSLLKLPHAKLTKLHLARTLLKLTHSSLTK